MKPLILILATGINLSPALAPAQGLVPTLNSEYDFCRSRPAEPEWMAELPSRERYKRLVIQTIYRAQGVERVVEAQECSCETRFPTWDNAVQHFNDNYLGGDRNRLREAKRNTLTATTNFVQRRVTFVKQKEIRSIGERNERRFIHRR
ncbi:MAG: hypothetical protein AAGB04_29620 [Pseudomonadota bacterium]